MDILARTRALIGSDDEWIADDLILGDGEVVVERPPSPEMAPRFKIGNGSARYSELPFAGVTLPPGSITFRGALDLTVDAPAAPVLGDQYISSVDGVVHGTFTGIAGQPTNVGDWAIYAGSAGWQLIPAGSDAALLRADLGDATDPAKGDAMIAVAQPFAGAAARDQHAKNLELISVADFFGGDPSGATSSAAAIAAAEAAADDIYLPPGTTFLAPDGTAITKRYWGPGRLTFSGIGTVAFAGAGLNDVTITGTAAQPRPLDLRIRIKALNQAGIAGAPNPCDTFEYSLNGGVTWIGTYDAYNPADDQVYALPLGLNAVIAFVGTGQKVGIPGTGAVPVFAANVGHTIGDTWAFRVTPHPHGLDSQSGLLSKAGIVYGGICGVNDTSVFLGRDALGNLNNAGNQLTALGCEALYANTTGYANTAVGITALRSNTSGFNNTAVGANALFSNTTGITNTAIGIYAGNSNTTGEGNVSCGADSNGYNDVGNGNTGIGTQALYHNKGGAENVAAGRYALRGGTESLSNGTAQSFCTAIGAYALYAGGGQFNTALGHQAGSKNKGNRNTFLGAETGSVATNISGADNIFAGYRSGQNAAQVNNVSDCIALGANTRTTGNNAIVIGSGAVGGLNQIIIGNNLHQGLYHYGHLLPQLDNTFSVGNGAARYTVIYATTGTINGSDERLKTFGDTSDAERRAALKCKALIRKYRWNDAIEKKGDGARWHFGVGAQSVADAFASEGLDAAAYGLFCYDEWPAEPAVTDETGEVLQPERPAGDRYGVRYDELAMFILAAI